MPHITEEEFLQLQNEMFSLLRTEVKLTVSPSKASQMLQQVLSPDGVFSRRAPLTYLGGQFFGPHAIARRRWINSTSKCLKRLCCLFARLFFVFKFMFERLSLSDVCLKFDFCINPHLSRSQNNNILINSKFNAFKSSKQFTFKKLTKPKTTKKKLRPF